MKVIDDLLSWAAQDDKIMGQMAAEETERQTKGKAYDALQSEFEKMADDGYLDKNELNTLIAQFKAQGLDTTALNQLADSLKNTDRVAVTSDLRNTIHDEISDKKVSLQDPDFNFKAQVLTSDYNQDIQTVATIQKSEHDKYMTAIRNLVA